MTKRSYALGQKSKSWGREETISLEFWRLCGLKGFIFSEYLMTHCVRLPNLTDRLVWPGLSRVGAVAGAKQEELIPLTGKKESPGDSEDLQGRDPPQPRVGYTLAERKCLEADQDC